MSCSSLKPLCVRVCVRVCAVYVRLSLNLSQALREAGARVPTNFDELGTTIKYVPGPSVILARLSIIAEFFFFFFFFFFDFTITA